MAVDTHEPVVLWVVPVPEFGGVARHVADVAAAGLPGFELAVLAPAGALTERLKQLGVQVIAAEFGPAAGFVASFKALNTAIDELQPVAVHSHLAYADVVAAAVVNAHKAQRLARRAVTVPQLVTTEHGIAGDDAVYHGTQLKARGRELMHRVRLWGTDRKIAVSDSTAQQMAAKWGARGVETIYNGVDAAAVRSAVERARAFSPGEGGPRVLSLSRLAPEKGLDVLVDAFAQVAADYPQARLELAGIGPLEQQLREQVRHLGLTDRVSFPGFVDPIQAMGRADVLVQLSVWENCSYTLLDTKSAGLSVVVTAVGGNPEIVSDAELVEPLTGGERDRQVTEIAEAMAQAWRREPAADFTWMTNAQMSERIARGYWKEARR